MDWFECKHRASRLLDDLRALRWSDPHQRRAILVLAGGAIGALLLIVALWQVVASATSTSSAEQAAQLNEDARRAAPAVSALERVRDVFTPRLRADNRFEAVLIRPGGSPDAPDAPDPPGGAASPHTFLASGCLCSRNQPSTVSFPPRITPAMDQPASTSLPSPPPPTSIKKRLIKRYRKLSGLVGIVLLAGHWA